ncbi:MAG: hypothetical protein IJU49_03700, partial [Lachnospiraceae bacterium]|nr:hypothetical protein [Lachnospiraceae bacterium]
DPAAPSAEPPETQTAKPSESDSSETENELVRVETLKGYGGKILGTIEYYKNGDKIAKDFGGRILGYYFASENKTRDFNKKIVSIGDMLLSLFSN